MISEAQRIAIRAYVLAACNLDRPAAMTALGAEQVVWELQDFPRGPDAWVSLQVVAATPTGNVERIERTVDDVLEVLHREPYEVTVSVTVRHQRSDSAPSWATDAGLRLRRVLLARASELHDQLAAAGCPIRRVSGMRDLSGLHRGTQWESTAQVDLVLDVMAQIVTRPGWAERLTGEVRVAIPDGGPLVIPFDTEA
jgi:hypothetical protein